MKPNQNRTMLATGIASICVMVGKGYASKSGSFMPKCSFTQPRVWFCHHNYSSTTVHKIFVSCFPSYNITHPPTPAGSSTTSASTLPGMDHSASHHSNPTFALLSGSFTGTLAKYTPHPPPPKPHTLSVLPLEF